MNKDTLPPDHSDEAALRIAYLMAGFVRHTLTEAEHIELDDWVCASMDNQRMFEQMIDPDSIKSWMKERSDR